MCIRDRTYTYNEHGPTEAAKAFELSAGPEHEASNTENKKTSYKSVSVAIATNDKRCKSRGVDKIGSEVGNLKSSRLCTGYSKNGLEVGIQRIQHSIGKPPKKEERHNK